MSTEIQLFNPKNVATSGNDILRALMAHEQDKAEAQARVQEADMRDKFIDVELTRIALYLTEQEKIDAYDIYSEDKASSSAIYNNVLTELGVLKREVVNDRVVYTWTDDEMREAYTFDKELKEANEAEYNQRRSRKTMLQTRLQRALKAAVSLKDAGVDAKGIAYRDNETTGEREVVIAKAPDTVAGKDKGEVVIHVGSGVKAREGAKFTPSIAGLAKAADAEHKAQSNTQAGADTGSNPDRSGATSEQDFLAMINTTVMTVKGREGTFSDGEKTALKNLLTLLKDSGIK